MVTYKEYSQEYCEISEWAERTGEWILKFSPPTLAPTPKDFQRYILHTEGFSAFVYRYFGSSVTSQALRITSGWASAPSLEKFSVW